MIDAQFTAVDGQLVTPGITPVHGAVAVMVSLSAAVFFLTEHLSVVMAHVVELADTLNLCLGIPQDKDSG